MEISGEEKQHKGDWKMSDRLNGKVKALAFALTDVIQGAVDDSTAKVIEQVRENNKETVQAVRDAILNTTTG